MKLPFAGILNIAIVAGIPVLQRFRRFFARVDTVVRLSVLLTCLMAKTLPVSSRGSSAFYKLVIDKLESRDDVTMQTHKCSPKKGQEDTFDRAGTSSPPDGRIHSRAGRRGEMCRTTTGVAKV